MSVRGAVPAENTRYHEAARLMRSAEGGAGADFLRSAFGVAGADPVGADALQARQFEDNMMRFVRSGEIDPAAAAAFLNRSNLGQGALAGNGFLNGKEENKDDPFWRITLFDQFRQMRERIQQYEEMANWYREQIQNAERDIKKLEDTRDKATAFLNDVEDIDGDFRRTGKLNREKCIEALKKRGVEVKPDASDQELRRALDRQKEIDRKIAEDANRLIEKIKAERDEYRRKLEETERKAKEARDQLNEIENSKDLTPQEKSEAINETLKNEKPKIAYSIGILEDDKKKKAEIDAKIKELTENAMNVASADGFNEGSEVTPDVSSKVSVIFNNSVNLKIAETPPPELTAPTPLQRAASPSMIN